MKVIVSLTSTFERSNLLFYGIQSILKQSFKPDLILVNISKKCCFNDSGFEKVPAWLSDADLKLNFISDIGPYGKLLPALEYADNNDMIVTADDDVLYDKNWLKNLVQAGKSDPDSIVCCTARIMKINIFSKWQNYASWDLINKRSKGFDILPLGVGGVVYRKKLLDIGFLQDRNFLEIAPANDDLWYKIASLRKNTPVSVFPEIDRQNIYLKHKFGLEKKNLCTAKQYNSILLRQYNKAKLRVLNYMAINQSRNDFYWDHILQYNQKIANRKISVFSKR